MSGDPIHAHIKDVAYLLHRRPTTIRSDWKARVEKGQLPPTLPGFAVPTWNREALIAWLEAGGPPRPEAQPRRTTAPKSARDGTTLRHLMAPTSTGHAA